MFVAPFHALFDIALECRHTNRLAFQPRGACKPPKERDREHHRHRDTRKGTDAPAATKFDAAACQRGARKHRCKTESVDPSKSSEPEQGESLV